MSETVKVMVRARPMNEKEINKKCVSCVKIHQQDNSITLTNPQDKDNTKQFSYDNVFDSDILQSKIYEQSAFFLVESVVEGFNGTIFAYGQTGCGKTHTMVGKDTEDLKGIIPRSFGHIVKIVNSQKDMKFLVRCSFIEIYNEQIQDLLGKDIKQKLDLKENQDKGVFIKDLSMHIVKTIEEMDKFMNIGTKNRSVGATDMNAESSRSHSIFTLYIEASSTDDKGNERFTAGKLNLVDLAGSERQDKTKATGVRLKEATKINLSLSALGNVISALVDGKSSHIPYRDSKLTRLLQDSLGGNTKTIMIANISPADYNYEETLSTLRYASRAKNIKNKPIVNEDPKDALLKEYAEEIKMLKQMLQNQKNGQGADQDALNQIQKTLDKTEENNQEVKIIQQTKIVEKQNDEEINKLQLQNNEINKKNEEILRKMQEKEQDFEKQKQEKEQIQQLLEQLNNKMMHQEQNDAIEQENLDKMRENLKKQAKKKKLLQKEKEKKEQEMLDLNKQFNTVQEELDSKNKVLEIYRKKYLEAQNEVKDLRREHENEKEDLLDTIRIQEQDYQLYKQIAEMLLKPQQIDQIRDASKWNDDQKQFNMPLFQLKAKEIQFPRLPRAQAKEFIENEKNDREISIEGSQSMQQNVSKQRYSTKSPSKSQQNYNQIQRGGSFYNNGHNKDDSLDDVFRQEIQFSNNINIDMNNKLRFNNNVRYDEMDLPPKPHKRGQSRPNQSINEKKQQPKQLEPMTDIQKINEKLDKNNIQQSSYTNPIFQDKTKMSRQNKLKPIEYGLENNEQINTFKSHSPLGNMQNQRKHSRNRKLEKIQDDN